MIKIKDLDKKVLQILEEIPETRNSDITLMIEVWKRFCISYLKVSSTGQLGVGLNNLYLLPREDTVKRYRAHIQNDLGLFLPTEWKIAKYRRIKEQVWKDYMGASTTFKRL